ncbi:MAG: hypothetical protein M3N04_04030, partial [Actinomycetota bacterium]|nr:hypothetical protein [Actinomycetota bacterium]
AEAKQEVQRPVARVAETAVLVPVGAALVARDGISSALDDIRSRYGTRASAERELRRFERRGSSALKRVERDARMTRVKVERELRERRTRVESELKAVLATLA